MRAWGSPGRYIQGKGVLDNLAKYTDWLGENICIVMDPLFLSEQVRYRESFSQSERTKNLRFCSYAGEVTKKSIDELVKQIQIDSPDLLIAIGGGKLIDVVKCVASELDTALVVCPTIAATDAPTSAMSILYTEAGQFDEIRLFPKNPDLVLVDSKVIARAPIRFFISGIGDALSTYFEGLANQRQNHGNYIASHIDDFRYTLSGMAVAQKCHDTLLSKGAEAVKALKALKINQMVEDVIECNVLMSGLGFENVGCSIAHAVGNAMTAIPAGEKMMHGERVAFGVLCQLKYEEEENTFEEIYRFMKDVELPTTLRQLGIKTSEDGLNPIVEAALKADSIHVARKPIDFNTLKRLIIDVDQIG